MIKFHTIPTSQLPQKQTRQATPQLSLDEKFEIYKKAAQRKHNGLKLREFHFICFEHEGFLFVMNGEKKIFAKLDNPNDFRTRREARIIYWQVIIGHEETEGGCYFDEF